ncbi:MAG: histidine phosphatase family protein [bacterium]
MTKIYLVRHGESLANTLGIYQGQTYDTVLSPLGRKQARTLRDYFQDKNIGALLASPLTRTQLTAKQVSLVTGLPIQTDPRLLETNHGQWEGLPKDEIQTRWGNLLIKWQTNPLGVVFPGGESFADLQTRILLWLSGMKETPVNTVIVTHDNFIRVVVAHLLSTPTTEFWRFPLDPAGVTTLLLDDGIITLEKINDNTHLTSCLTNLSLHAL